MRRSIPFALVGLLSAIALIAAILSVQNSPRFDFFAQPSAGNPRTVQAFRAAVDKTLNSRSFRERYNRDIVISYQAPNRTSDPFVGIRVIGSKAYFELSRSESGIIRWGEYPLTKDVDDTAGPLSVQEGLQSFLDTKGIYQTGDGYKVEVVVEANDVSPGTAGQALIIGDVAVRNGFISSVRSKAYAPITSLKNNPNGTVSRVVLKSEIVATATYSDFGHIRIAAPKRNRVVRLIRCTSGTGVTEIDNELMCVSAHI